MATSLPLKIVVVCLSVALAGGYVVYVNRRQAPAPAVDLPVKKEPVVLPGSKSAVFGSSQFQGADEPINRETIDKILNDPNRGKEPKAVLPGSKSGGIFIEPIELEKPPLTLPPAPAQK